jgi:class I fructose-bisphosphate aldolase
VNKPRINRLLGPSGKGFIIAIDHGFFNEPAFVQGIENFPRTLDRAIAAGPNGILTSIGHARHLQDRPGSKPALVVRADVSNIYAPAAPSKAFDEPVADAVETAIRLDAACVIANLFHAPEDPDVYRDGLRIILKLRAECERYAMPLMVEPLPMRRGENGGYEVDMSIERTVALVRQTVELGADIVKADPTSTPEQFHRVIEVAGGTPVMVRGGGRVSDREILERTAELMRHGLAGIVYGRNILQHPDPTGMTQALMAVVHEGATAEQALEALRATA